MNPIFHATSKNGNVCRVESDISKITTWYYKNCYKSLEKIDQNLDSVKITYCSQWREVGLL